MSETFVVEDQPDLTIPEDVIVRAKVVDLTKETVEYKDRKTNEDKSFDKLIWWFEVTTEAYAGRKIRGETDARITNHSTNRFRQWAETLLGRELNVGTGLTLDDLIGLSADITVGKRADRNDAKKFYDFVDEVLPVNGGGFSDEPPF